MAYSILVHDEMKFENRIVSDDDEDDTMEIDFDDLTAISDERRRR
jgi:hypothetical protein